jgi:hypothetical protein
LDPGQQVGAPPLHFAGKHRRKQWLVAHRVNGLEKRLGQDGHTVPSNRERQLGVDPGNLACQLQHVLAVAVGKAGEQTQVGIVRGNPGDAFRDLWPEELEAPEVRQGPSLAPVEVVAEMGQLIGQGTIHRRSLGREIDDPGRHTTALQLSPDRLATEDRGSSRCVIEIPDRRCNHQSRHVMYAMPKGESR